MKRSFSVAALASVAGAVLAFAAVTACQSDDEPTGAAGSSVGVGCSAYGSKCGGGNAAALTKSCKDLAAAAGNCSAQYEAWYGCIANNGCTDPYASACKSAMDDYTACFSGVDGGQGGSGGGGGGAGGSAGGAAGEGQGGSAGSSNECFAAETKTVEEIAKGGLASGVAVRFNAVATTEPVLAYTSKTKGSCLWAVFVKDPAKDVGTMVMSYGPNMETLADGGVGDCAPNPLFAGIVAGDQLDITGQTSPYAPASCAADGGVAPAEQMQVAIDMKNVACLKKTGSGAAPAPVKVTDIDGLATGKADYQGLLVELNNVDAVDWPDGGTVGPYGIIKIKGTNQNLEIHDKFYYKAEGAPKFPAGTHFNKIVGISHLDFCTWSLQPMHLCDSFDPKSEGCP